MLHDPRGLIRGLPGLQLAFRLSDSICRHFALLRHQILVANEGVQALQRACDFVCRLNDILARRPVPAGEEIFRKQLVQLLASLHTSYEPQTGPEPAESPYIYMWLQQLAADYARCCRNPKTSCKPHTRVGGSDRIPRGRCQGFGFLHCTTPQTLTHHSLYY